MATLMEALRSADAAGDSEAANRFAVMIKEQKASEAEQAEPEQTIPQHMASEVSSDFEKLKGVADAGAAIVSTLAGQAVGGAVGASAAGSPLLDYTPQEGEEISQSIQELDIFNIFPLSEQGKKNVKAIGENEALKSITEFFNTANDMNAEFGFDLLDPIGKAMGIENLGAIGGTAGKITIDTILTFLSGGAAKLALSGAKGAFKGAEKVVKGAAGAAEKAGEITGKALVERGVGGPGGITVKDIFEYQTPAKRRLAARIKSGSTDLETVGFKALEPDKKPISPTPVQKALGVGEPKLAKDTPDNAAARQGWDKGVIASIKTGTNTDKAKFREMTNIMEKGKKNAEFAAENTPSDVLGRSLMERYRVVKKANDEAGPKINAVAETLKGKPIDIELATATFDDRLADLGIRLVPAKDGGFKANFDNSTVGPGDRGPLKEVLRVMSLKGRGEIDGFTVHEMKRIIDDNVTFGKTKTGIGGRMESALKEFRRGLDESLDSTFPEYNEANLQYSSTIDVLDEFQELTGKKTDLTRPSGEKQVGKLLRRILSNAQSRSRVLDVAEDIESVAAKYVDKIGPLRIGDAPAKPFNDSIIKQVIYADELDRQFGAVARTSLQGQMAQAMASTAKAAATKTGLIDATISLAGKGVEKARRINDKNAYKAIREILKDTPTKPTN